MYIHVYRPIYAWSMTQIDNIVVILYDGRFK